MRCQGWLSLVLVAAACLAFAGCRAAGPSVRGLFSGHRPSPVAATTASNSAVGVAAPESGVRPPDDSVRTTAYVNDQPDPEEPPRPGLLADEESAASAPVGGGPAASSPAESAAHGPLDLSEVVQSVMSAYPPLIVATLERRIADGRELSAWGAFDLQLQLSSIAAPEGFYETYRNGIALEQPVFPGGYLYGGYRIGRGNFQPWYGERETNDGGELSGGFGVPLLQNRTIDKRREGVFQTNLARQAVEPMVRAQLLEFVRLASRAYWSWIAAGQALAAQRELLDLARQRVEQIEARVAAGDLERIARLNNEQLIAAREAQVIQAERRLQEAAIRLSLFLRTESGAPRIPDDSSLPAAFPDHFVPDDHQLGDDIDRAVTARPELRELSLLAEQVRVELAQAENQLLPKLDARVWAGKDVGGPSSPKRDKTPYEMEVGLYGDVPLQRREAQGKVETARGKLAQIEARRRFMVDRVTAAVQDAYSALEAAAGRIERSRTNLRLARETLALGREQFNAGDIDLIALNIYEQAVNDAQLVLISAEAEFFAAVADYQAALSLDPEQL